MPSPASFSSHQPQELQCPASSSSPDTTKAAKEAEPYVVEDCLGVLQVLSDGTVVRSEPRPYPAGDGYDDGRVECKDLVYSAAHNLGVRVYKPKPCRSMSSSKSKKLPVLVYFHGGGFCFGSYSWPKNHVSCLRLAAELPAIVLSFDYRLGPEHRLPAAIDDAVDALLWLPRCIFSDPWLADANSSHRVFICGQSSGASLAHYMLLRFGTASLDSVAGTTSSLGLLTIAGYILLMPAFFSEQPTQSELDTPDTALLSRKRLDMYFRLGYPVGASKDGPLSNPLAPNSPCLLSVDVGRMLVVAAEHDLVRDKNVEYAERLKALGQDVELVLFPGQEHAFFATKPLSPASDNLLLVIGAFVHCS